MMRNSSMFLLTLIISAVLVGCFFAQRTSFTKSSLYKDVVLANDVLISSEWKEIEAKNSMRVEKDNQFVSISLELPYEADAINRGIKTSTNIVAKPEIKIVDENGDEYILHFIGSRGGEQGNEIANYGYKNGYKSLPFDKSFKKVLFRSTEAIKTREILWSGYDAEDLE